MTLQNLVEPMGISTKTVYKYFIDKEDLLEQCLMVHYSAFSDQLILLEKAKKNPVVVIAQLWQEGIDQEFGASHLFYEDLNYYYPVLQDKVLSKLFKKSRQVLLGLIEKGIREGYFRPRLSALVVLETMHLMITSITRTNRFKGPKTDPNLVLQNTINIYLRGLCTARGLKAFNKHLPDSI